MRNTLLRKVLAFAGVVISGASCGMLFAYVIACAKLGFFLQFVLTLIALLLAMIANFVVVIPKLNAWAFGRVESLIDGDAIKAQLNKYLNSKAAPAA